MNTSAHSKQAQGLLIATSSQENQQNMAYLAKNAQNQPLATYNPAASHSASTISYNKISNGNLKQAKGNPTFPIESYSTISKVSRFKSNNAIQQQQHIQELATNRSKTPGPDTIYFRNELESEQEELDLYLFNVNNNANNNNNNNNNNTNVNRNTGNNANASQRQVNHMHRSKTPTAEMMSNHFESSTMTASNNNFKNFNSSSTMLKRKPLFNANQSHHEEMVNSWNQPDFFLNDFTIDDVKYDEYGNCCVEMFVELYRQENGFGFKIIGGKETDSQVAIGYIVYGGAAHMDNRLRPNDELISIDNECVLGATHKRVIQLMAIAGLNGKVKLKIKRKLNKQQFELLVNQSANMEKQRMQKMQTQQRQQQQQKLKSQPLYPFTITLFRNPGEDFGFLIVSPLDKNGIQLIGIYL